MKGNSLTFSSLVTVIKELISRFQVLVIIWCAITFLVVLLPNISSLALASEDWSVPQTISAADAHGSHPTLIADSRGVVHAFWETRPVPQADAPWAIAYARLEDGIWSKPVEIMLSPGAQGALYPRVLTDDVGRMHLFWSGDGEGRYGPIYHSWAPIDRAADATAWSQASRLADGTLESDVGTTPDGAIHLIYANVLDVRGICHRYTKDGGKTWGDETCIERDYVLRNDETETRPRLAIDSHGILHVVWILDDYSPSNSLAYAGRAIYYARSVDNGRTWSAPRPIDIVDGRDPEHVGNQPEWGNIAVDDKDRVHLVWVGSPDMYRYHVYSEDGGLTWATRVVAIPSGGYNNWQGLAVDSEGVLHLVWPSLEGIEYAFWEDGTWSPAGAVASKAQVGDAHHADAIVALGNQLHSVWQDHGGDISESRVGRILYSWTEVESTSELARPVSTLVPNSEPRLATVSDLNNPDIKSTATSPTTKFPLDSLAENNSTIGNVLLLSLFPVLLLVLTVALWRLRKR